MRHAARDHFERLHTADGRLHMGVEVLDAEAGPVDAHAGEPSRKRRVHGAGVELDRVLHHAGEVESLGQPGRDAQQPIRAEQARRSAAPVDVGDAASGRRGRQEVDLLQQRLRVGVQRIGAPHRLGVAAAIGADRRAVRNVQIDREARRRRQLSKPVAGHRSIDRAGEVRGRVARVAGRGAFGEDQRGRERSGRHGATCWRPDALLVSGPAPPLVDPDQRFRQRLTPCGAATSR